MTVEPIKIAILAMGGEGGGVLADWIVDLGEANGYFAQTTSVPRVAQRTGATIYYVELFPGAADAPRVPRARAHAHAGRCGCGAGIRTDGGRPRGAARLRHQERTTLIASSHRVYSIAEKSAMGDGRRQRWLARQAREAARHFFSFDMAEAAERAGSVVSAVLFGALSGSGVLPFSREQFEATIERGGVGVKPSLKAFDAGYARARPGQPDGTADAPRPMPADAAPAPAIRRSPRCSNARAGSRRKCRRSPSRASGA